MSKQNVTGFFASLAGNGEDGLSDDPVVAEVISRAKENGFEFSEAELHSAMKEMIFTAQSLPRNWGWSLARSLGLVHKT